MTCSPSIIKKLNPARFDGISPKMSAIVGCIVGKAFTTPVIAEFHISSDGFMLARHDNDIGFNDFIGSAEDFESNWTRLLDVAGLNKAERTEVETRRKAVTTDERR